MQNELSFSLIASQSMNFLRNRRLQIIVSCALLAILSVVVANLLLDGEASQQLTDPEALSTAELLSLLGRSITVSLVTSIITAAVLTAVIYNLSINSAFHFPFLLSKTGSNALNIIGFNLVYIAIFIFIGTLLLLIVSILPTFGSAITLVIAISLALALMAVYYLFLGAIVEPTKLPFFQLFMQIHRLAKTHWKLALSAIVIRCIAALLIGVTNWFIGTNIIMLIILSTLMNLVDCFMICFFYRLYTLLNVKPVISDSPSL